MRTPLPLPMMNRLVSRVWGEAQAFLGRTRRFDWTDVWVGLGIVGLVFAAVRIAGEWTGPLRPAVHIDLSPWALPRYTLFSLSRGLIAYAISLGFTLGYGYWAAHDRRAERLLIPLLDILQSIPILGFMPGLVLALATVFPHTNVGLELAAVLMMFTGQVWNMTFSFYHSLRSIPSDLREVSTVYRFSAWQRLRQVELPAATVGLVWNSMMSMAGGWFFLMINEAFVLGRHDFRLPGLGAYMSVAVAEGNAGAQLWAMVAMVLMIVALDQVLWRPLVVWSLRFRVEESAQAQEASSWMLDWLRRSLIVAALRQRLTRTTRPEAAARGQGEPAPVGEPSRWAGVLSVAAFLVLLVTLGYGMLELLRLLARVRAMQWGGIVTGALMTLGRVAVSTALGTLWAVPAGLAIGLSPRLSRALQPVVQVAASFPAPMLYPLVIAGLHRFGVPLGWGSILLMLLGTQWYILFNVIAGATAIPTDLREAARSYRISGLDRLRRVYLPAVFPFLVTGWVTAAGGAWNASVVAEFVTFRGHVQSAWGVGSEISRAAERADFPALAAGVFVLSTVVVLLNRTVWRTCYRLAAERFSLTR